jgi:DNA-directed RNA polymerase subunit beta
MLQPSVPESFNVLVKELQGLGLDVRLERREHVVTGAELFDQLVQRELAQKQETAGEEKAAARVKK